MKKKVSQPAVHLDADMVATQISIRICEANRAGGLQRFNLWFEGDYIKAYVRYTENLTPFGDNPEKVLCLANVVVLENDHVSARHLGGLTKLLEHLENKAHLHQCRFYVESVVTNWVMKACTTRGYKAQEQENTGIFNYWFTGKPTITYAEPDLFTAQETEEFWKENGQ